MIVRIVKLTFAPEKVSDFLSIFRSYKLDIESSDGCLHLELLRDRNNPNVFMTYSHWLSEENLNSYRKSQLFEEVWTKTKTHFIDKPQAWSVESVE